MPNNTIYGRSILDDIEAGEAIVSAKAITRLAPFCVDEKPSCIAGVYRAFQPGWRPRGGGERVTLESVPARGGKATTQSALLRFMHRLDVIQIKPPTSSAANRRASRELAAAGW